METAAGHSDSPANAARTCRCGYDRTHHMVSREPVYSFWDWVLILFGISKAPQKIVFRCRRCQQAFDESDDPAELKHEA